MKKTILKGTALLTVLVMVMCLLGACGGSAKYSGSSSPAAMPAPAASFGKAEYAADNGWYVAAEEPMAPMEDAEYWDGSESYNTSGEIGSIRTETLEKANVKLIYRASMSVQTLEFEETQKNIRMLVDSMGGWFETNESYYGGYFGKNNMRNAYYTVRIPASQYSEFLSAIGNTCHVVNVSQSVEDVSLAYSDIENRLETLETKHDRLIELLSKATEMKDIIELENALSECEYQIDNYSQSKNRYDSLIGYSTVNIDVSEVQQLADSVVEDQSFFARLGRTLKRGADNFLDGLDDFVMWFSYHLIGIIIFLIIAIIVIRLIRSFNDPEKRAVRAAAREEKRAARKAAAAEKRGKASPFKSENAPEQKDLTDISKE